MSDFEKNVAFLQVSDWDDAAKKFKIGKEMIVMCQGSYCGACKMSKPAYGEAAAIAKKKGSWSKSNKTPFFATVHADSENQDEKEVCEKVCKLHDVKGFPPSSSLTVRESSSIKPSVPRPPHPRF